MAMQPLSATPLTGVERIWTEDELIVSKTDTRGIITYANRIFLRIAQLTEEQAVGASHNIIRHPAMPRCIFKLLWDTVASGKEIFAYVINRATGGDHYWVFAHVSPTFDANGTITDYHSNRRKPKAEQVRKIEAIYKLLLDEERKHSSPKDGLEASTKLLHTFLKDRGVSYEEFVFTI